LSEKLIPTFPGHAPSRVARRSPGSVAEHWVGSAASSSGRPNLPPLQGLDRRCAG
jgi:hypothetical protein